MIIKDGLRIVKYPSVQPFFGGHVLARGQSIRRRFGDLYFCKIGGAAMMDWLKMIRRCFQGQKAGYEIRLNMKEIQLKRLK